MAQAVAQAVASSTLVHIFMELYNDNDVDFN